MNPMRAAGASIAKTSVNLCLLLASCAAGLFLCELSLRLFYPKYHDLADAPFRRDASRIWARMPNARNWWPHPDTRLSHALHHNNFALRQHRNFSAADLASAINVGVFGDSFVENIRMDAPYSFTEPLDWLLNQGPRRFNVLNFGVEGYGPGQSFLHHEHFRHADDLDYVFFMFYHNDLENVHETGLFDLDEAGRLARNEAMRSSWWTRFISELHVSYLLLDVSGQSFFRNPETAEPWIRSAGGFPDDDVQYSNTLTIFQRLMRRWKQAVERNGGGFVIVLPPDSPADPRITTLLEEEDVEMIDLYDCFGMNNEQWERLYRFKSDYHWNENGNRLAAVCLYRFLEEKMRFSDVSEDALRETLHQYYSAFGGWTPPAPPQGGASPRTAAGVRDKYQALGEADLAEVRKEVEKLIQAPEKRIIRSVFDVYLDGRELVYVKDDCSETDVRRRLFLKRASVDGESFFEEAEVRRYCCRFMSSAVMIDEALCAAKRSLPDYPVPYIVTGQPREVGRPAWQAEAVIDRDAFRKALEKIRKALEQAVAPEKLVIRSDFDVYLDGKELTYVKDVCSPPDLRRRFFLHVTPADERNLPEGRAYDNRDFNQVGVHVDAFGCVVRRRLPGYAVRHVRTGQTVRVEGNWEPVWEGEFSVSRAADVVERRSVN